MWKVFLVDDEEIILNQIVQMGNGHIEYGNPDKIMIIFLSNF